MRVFLACLGCLILAAAFAQADTINTTFSINNATLNLVTGAFSGPITFASSSLGSGTFSGTLAVDSSGNFSGPFTITLSGGTITGTVMIPGTVIAGGGIGSATITGGTGAYVNATGNLSKITGSGSSAGTTFNLTLNGNASITTGGPPSPVISAVLDAASYTPSVSQGEVFVVKGTNLSASGLFEASYPLQTNFNGVSITFTAVGATSGTNAPLIYLYNQGGVNQLAAIVPSSLAPGTYNVTVTNNGTTGPAFQTTVVKQKAAIITRDATGNGLAVIQNYISASELDVDSYTKGAVSGITISPAYGGQTEILWVLGLGAAPGASDTGPASVYNFIQNGVSIQVKVNGTLITPSYAGPAPGLTGVGQVNFTLPTNIATGCVVAITIVENGVESQATTYMSIATDASASACVQTGFTSSQLQQFDNGLTITTGGFIIDQFAETIPSVGAVKLDSSSGAFTQFSGFELASIPPQGTSTTGLPIGNCIVTKTSGGTSGFIAAGGINLDAGKVTLTGPSGSNLSSTAYTETNNTYSLQIGAEGASIPGFGNGSIVAGTYSIHGAGGTGVNAFDASVTLGTPLTITGGLPTSIVRANGFALAWTGGNPSDLVEIYGSTMQTSGTTSNTIGFICFTTAGQGGFTVPSSITNQLYQVSTSGGFVGVGSGVFPSSGNGLFNFTLVSDGSSHQGTFTALVGTGGQATYQ